MSQETLTPPPRCRALVWKRDTYRYTGRGKNGFEMHYSNCQCERRAVDGDLCRQHAKIASRREVLRVSWA